MSVARHEARRVLAARLADVERRLDSACRRVGRSRTEVTVIAVTKTVGPDIAALLPELGVLDLGENRPQELWRKAAALPPTVRWHMIGHLQRNKIDRMVPLVRLIHSVDSLRLLAALDELPGDDPLPVLLEVNISAEASKHGFTPEEAEALGAELAKRKRVRVVGLMTMAALHEDVEKCRPTFAALRQLRKQLRQRVGDRHPLTELSMGMSNDFEVAVEEGATLVRLGTVLFAGLEGDG
jgi:pyridoxal phosphate enzyme (YggS family)